MATNDITAGERWVHDDPEALAQFRAGVKQVERGDVVSLGSFMAGRSLADNGLISYRCRSSYGGWIMIGARDHEDAIKQAYLSKTDCQREGLEIWDGSAYVKVQWEAAE